jgi:hypothetical protein
VLLLTPSPLLLLPPPSPCASGLGDGGGERIVPLTPFTIPLNQNNLSRKSPCLLDNLLPRETSNRRRLDTSPLAAPVTVSIHHPPKSTTLPNPRNPRRVQTSHAISTVRRTSLPFRHKYNYSGAHTCVLPISQDHRSRTISDPTPPHKPVCNVTKPWRSSPNQTPTDRGGTPLRTSYPPDASVRVRNATPSARKRFVA